MKLVSLIMSKQYTLIKFIPNYYKILMKTEARQGFFLSILLFVFMFNNIMKTVTKGLYWYIEDIIPALERS